MWVYLARLEGAFGASVGVPGGALAGSLVGEGRPGSSR
jgi:hypothetical protein